MRTNAQKIQAWRDAHPGERITAAVLLEVLELVDLWGANLTGADLRGADLRGANLRGANLQGADLWDAKLRDVDLSGANLRGANLQGADLWDAKLRGANLQDAGRLTMQLRGMPSGELVLFPTPEGWMLSVGCWNGTPDALRELIAGDEGWPEARGDEVAKRRPYLEAALTLVDMHIAARPDVIEELSDKWNKENA